MRLLQALRLALFLFVIGIWLTTTSLFVLNPASRSHPANEWVTSDLAVGLFTPVDPCTFQASAAQACFSDVPAVLISNNAAVCDTCRTICARSCSSYSCLACDRSIKCGAYVISCKKSTTPYRSRVTPVKP